MTHDIESIQHEGAVYPPPGHLAGGARIATLAEYRNQWEAARRDPEGFWGAYARGFTWFTPWSRVLEWKLPDAVWFKGATTNLAYNCLDRQIEGGRGNQAAIITEPETGEVRTLTYRQLLREVCGLAGALRSRGVGKGDRVGIYLPNTAEAAIAMLACARIGAPHTVIFGGFSAKSISERLNDCRAVAVITADGLRRRGQIIPLKSVVDEALVNVPSVHTVIVDRNVLGRWDAPEGYSVPMQSPRDVFWGDVVKGEADFVAAEQVDAEHPLFLLYTSGTTGKPKGILHTTGGYVVWAAYTAAHVFELREGDTFFCTADVGWITGHSYVVYGLLLNGGTTLMYEGGPTYPTPSRFWQIIERHRVNIFYTAPTAIRAFMRLGEQHVTPCDLSSLRVLGSVGEPINPEAWRWYYRVIGRERCPIVDTWWQTETGGVMISPLAAATPTKPGSATYPLPGVVPAILDGDDHPVPMGHGGKLVITAPWPGMLRGLWGDRERFIATYFASGKYYLTGDAAHQDHDGNYWLMGRMDDVVNVSGHRLGTAEVESALVSHPAVAEAAVVSRPDDLTGSAIVAFVTTRVGSEASDHAARVALAKALGEHVSHEIGKIARPAEIHVAPSLPKTRSGKIMRRLLRDIARGNNPAGDLSTLEDPSVLQSLQHLED